MKRIYWILPLLLCISGCHASFADAPRTEPPPVLVMSSPERTTERSPVEEPAPDPEPPDSRSVPTEPAAAMTDPAEQTTEPEAPEGLYLLVNGTRLAIGLDYADVRDSIGPQIAPAQALSNCDSSCFGTVHFYPGLTVTETEAGVIRGIELSSQFAGESDAALLGRVGLGTSLEDAVAALGQPENELSYAEDRMLVYRQEGQEICVCFLDEENQNAVSSIIMTASAE